MKIETLLIGTFVFALTRGQNFFYNEDLSQQVPVYGNQQSGYQNSPSTSLQQYYSPTPPDTQQRDFTSPQYHPQVSAPPQGPPPQTPPPPPPPRRKRPQQEYQARPFGIQEKPPRRLVPVRYVDVAVGQVPDGVHVPSDSLLSLFNGKDPEYVTLTEYGPEGSVYKPPVRPARAYDTPVQSVPPPPPRQENVQRSVDPSPQISQTDDFQQVPREEYAQPPPQGPARRQFVQPVQPRRQPAPPPNPPRRQYVQQVAQPEPPRRQYVQQVAQPEPPRRQYVQQVAQPEPPARQYAQPEQPARQYIQQAVQPKPPRRHHVQQVAPPQPPRRQYAAQPAAPAQPSPRQYAQPPPNQNIESSQRQSRPKPRRRQQVQGVEEYPQQEAYGPQQLGEESIGHRRPASQTRNQVRGTTARRAPVQSRPPSQQRSGPPPPSANLAVKSLPEDTDGDGLPGVAGTDYPTLHVIPSTSFSCRDQPHNGYYADLETACQVVHLCQAGGVQNSFLCPNGTIFNQEKFSCQWWFKVQCESAPHYYGLNDNLYKVPGTRDEEEEEKK